MRLIPKQTQDAVEWCHVEIGFVNGEKRFLIQEATNKMEFELEDLKSGAKVTSISLTRCAEWAEAAIKGPIQSIDCL